MSNYFNAPSLQSASVFKIPLAPPSSRSRKPRCNNTQTTQSTYTHGIDIPNNMERNNNVSLNKLHEQLEVLNKLYAPDDNVWESMIHSMNELCYQKLSEQILQPNSRGYSFVPDENESVENTTSGLYVPSFPSKPAKVKELTVLDSIMISPVRRNKVRPTKVNNSIKESTKENVPVARELNVLLSEDEGDSLTAFFQKRRRPATKTSTTGASAKTALKDRVKSRVSISLSRIDNQDEPSSSAKRKRSSSGSTSVKRQSVTKPEADSTVTEPPKVRKKRVPRLPSKRAANSVASADAAKNCVVSSSKPEEVVKRKVKKVSAKSSKPVVVQPSSSNVFNGKEANLACGFRQLEDNSFFGDVSSIAGISSPAVDTVKKNKNKNTDDGGNDTALQFFDQFENVRSTSCFSAMSTPLSKTTAKNTLGKRLKKPSVAAELKDQLKPARKPKKVALKAITEQQFDNTAGTTESDCVVSDFSDDD